MATGKNDFDFDQASIASMLGFIAAKRMFDAENPVYAALANAAGSGVPEATINGALAKAGFDGAATGDRAIVRQVTLALRMGKRLIAFREMAQAAKDSDPSITTTVTAWAFKMAAVAVAHSALSDKAVFEHSDSAPSHKSDAERGASRRDQAVKLLREETAGLMGLDDAEKAVLAKAIQMLRGLGEPKVEKAVKPAKAA